MPLFKRRREAPDLAGLRQECRAFIAELELSSPDEDWIATALYYGNEGPMMAAFDLDPPDIIDALDAKLDEYESTVWGLWATTWMVAGNEVEEAPGVRRRNTPVVSKHSSCNSAQRTRAPSISRESSAMTTGHQRSGSGKSWKRGNRYHGSRTFAKTRLTERFQAAQSWHF